MKLHPALLALTLTISTALHAAPSAEACALFANMKLDQFATILTDHQYSPTGLSPEKEKILKEEFSSDAYLLIMCEHFDKTYSETELREMNELWKQPAMQRLSKEMIGKNAPLNKISGDWTLKYHQRLEALKGEKKE